MIAYFLICAVLIGASYGLYTWWHRRIDEELSEGAEYEFSRFQTHEPELLKNISQDEFTQLYRKTEMPRAPGYALTVVSFFLLGTPFALALLSAGDWAMNRLNVVPESSDVVAKFMLDENGQAKLIHEVPPVALQYYVEDLGGFYYFFGMILFWVLVVAYFMRRYHQRRPGFLRDEIIRAR